MINTNANNTKVTSNKQRSYNECVAFLEGLANYRLEPDTITRVLALDKACGTPSAQLQTIIFGGNNGKSLSMLFTSKLFQEEHYSVGMVYAHHVLTFSERFFINDKPVSNKVLAETLSEVINKAIDLGLEFSAYEIITVTALQLFAKEKVNIALMEVGNSSRYDACAAFNPIIAAITNLACKNKELSTPELEGCASEMMAIAKPGTWLVCAEQSKLRLQKMKRLAEGLGAKWLMPVRKLAPLPYIFEQLYGRYASLGERIVQIFVEEVQKAFSPFLRRNLLATEKGKRGRPTLEAKKAAELNPIKTIEGFWKTKFELKHSKFELLDKEKPTVLLDDASNFDGLDNLFLGIRLLHYKRPINGLCIIMGLNINVDPAELMKLLRYLFKRVTGEIFFISLPDANVESHDPETLLGVAREFNVRAHVANSVQHAFGLGKGLVDDKEGIVCITGSKGMVCEYWKEVRETRKI